MSQIFFCFLELLYKIWHLIFDVTLFPINSKISFTLFEIDIKFIKFTFDQNVPNGDEDMNNVPDGNEYMSNAIPYNNQVNETVNDADISENGSSVNFANDDAIITENDSSTSVIVDDVDTNSGNVQCVICRLTIMDETAMTLSCPCRAAYHPQCISQWLDRSGSSCPICRGSSSVPVLDLF